MHSAFEFFYIFFSERRRAPVVRLTRSRFRFIGSERFVQLLSAYFLRKHSGTKTSGARV